VWHIYCIRVPAADEVLAKLNAAGVGAAIHYPVPVHRTGAFAEPGRLVPEREAAGPEILSLPIYPQITPQLQERVAEALSPRVTVLKVAVTPPELAAVRAERAATFSPGAPVA
jgi:dTDP-4-amino-4,6-dideoxygalactose transaminase